MSTYADILIEKYKAKGLLVDSNLALLYLVGFFDRKLIGDGKYNKLSKYNQEDYELPLRLTHVFKKSVTTPHVLTEVSNLVNDLPEATKMACLRLFHRAFINIDELAVPSLEVSLRPDFHFLGLTDSALAQVSDNFLILTDDARLVQKMSENGLNSLNFNHIRAHLFFPSTSTNVGASHRQR